MQLFYSARQCPNCGGELYRSHRRGFVQSFAFRLLLIRAYRCERCGQRFYIAPTVLFEGARPQLRNDPDEAVAPRNPVRPASCDSVRKSVPGRAR